MMFTLCTQSKNYSKEKFLTKFSGQANFRRKITHTKPEVPYVQATQIRAPAEYCTLEKTLSCFKKIPRVDLYTVQR